MMHLLKINLTCFIQYIFIILTFLFFPKLKITVNKNPKGWLTTEMKQEKNNIIEMSNLAREASDRKVKKLLSEKKKKVKKISNKIKLLQQVNY